MGALEKALGYILSDSDTFEFLSGAEYRKMLELLAMRISVYQPCGPGVHEFLSLRICRHADEVEADREQRSAVVAPIPCLGIGTAILFVCEQGSHSSSGQIEYGHVNGDRPR